jgi:aminoglycoside/choline kinase family phosphotransferase
MGDRADHIAAFLADAGWGAAARRPLADDASFRRYERLSLDERRAVLMDAPPPEEDVNAFHRVERLLLSLGLSAPRALAVNQAEGLMLLEDLGDRTFTRALAEGDDERALYELAVDVLIHLHLAADAKALAAAPLPDYDDGRLLQEALLLTDWYLPALSGAETPAAVRDAYIEAWRSVFPLARRVPPTLVLRDYHVDNLMVLEGRPGIAGCGLLDFQDAVIGPRSYDLVSLLEDARRDIPVGLIAAMLARYLAAFPETDPAAFQASYAILGAQRSAKIIGIFTRLCRRDGKDLYLRHIPRVWRLLEGDLTAPELAPVKAWFDEVLPPGERRVPSAEAA